ncbi:MAG: hypothetical protein JSV21_06535 [Nitrospirota bacterium]|nr:MAG: hypothetical protein JSV21_06535 [Nitrospirota bacterium]
MPADKTANTCSLIKEKIDAGIDITATIKTSIQMGFDTCSMIKCSIKNNGDLKQVIDGAVQAGMPTEVIARCAIDAGADPQTLAGILADTEKFSLCYLPPRDEVIPVGVSFPGGRDNRSLSPSVP